MMTTTGISAAKPADVSEFTYLQEAVKAHFARTMDSFGPHLYTVDIDGDKLYEIYLKNLPVQERKGHTCNCCKDFIRKFGNLAVLTPNDGIQISAVWPASLDSVPEIYRDSIREMSQAVNKANVTGVYLWDNVGIGSWGVFHQGGWNHFHLTPPPANHTRRDMNASQMMALKKEDFKCMIAALLDFKQEVVAKALNFLESEALYRGEKFVAPAKFLLNLQEKIETRGGKNQKIRDRFIWQAVAAAPPGWATPRSGMIGTLLVDIKDGLDFGLVKSRFAAKMDPTQYQRPQSAPSEGNIQQAEKLFRDMGLEPALHRRFMRYDECEFLWQPQELKQKKQEGGIFGHLRQNPPQPVNATEMDIRGTVNVTWEKFRKKILPKAKQIQIMFGRGEGLPLAGMLTAVHADSPPILKWDSNTNNEERSQGSWYLYKNGSRPMEWGLSCQWNQVNGVCLLPCNWHGRPEGRFDQGAIFIIEGCRDRNINGQCLFPEILKADLHAVRKTIEAYSSKAGPPQGKDEANANGLMYSAKGDSSIIRVVTDAGPAFYRIDRWD